MADCVLFPMAGDATIEDDAIVDASTVVSPAELLSDDTNAEVTVAGSADGVGGDRAGGGEGAEEKEEEVGDC